MDHYVTDTHALFWYLVDSPNLGAAASRCFEDADAGKARIVIPTIVLAELADVIARLKAGSQFVFVPFVPDDVLDFDSDARVTEMHDRMIAGVARRLGIPLLTVDGNIIASGVVRTIW